MNILLLDTATDTSIIALSVRGKIASAVQKKEFLQSRFLLASIDILCREEGITPAALSCVAVGVGPGSYTGIRVGVAAAKGIAYALKIPLIGVSTLTGLVPDGDGAFLSVLDAKMGGIYCLEGVCKQGQATFAGTPEVLSVAAFEQRLPRVQYVVTPSWNQIRERINTQVVFPTVVEKELSATALFHEVQRAVSRKHWSLDGELSIFYLRQAVA